MRFSEIDRRFAEIHRLIENRNTGSAITFSDKLKIAKSTLYRYFKIMREEYQITVEYDNYIESFVYPKNIKVSYGGTFSITHLEAGGETEAS